MWNRGSRYLFFGRFTLTIERMGYCTASGHASDDQLGSMAWWGQGEAEDGEVLKTEPDGSLISGYTLANYTYRF